MNAEPILSVVFLGFEYSAKSKKFLEKSNLSKTKIAENMSTDTAQLNHLLDPDNTSITLESLNRLARAMGKHLRIELA